MNNFAIFILSHGRADKVYTMKTLERVGYTGAIYILLDNEDNQIEKYKKNYGEEKIIVFDKEKALKTYQGMSNFYKKNVILWARNEAQRIAKEKGIRYILELDDDYTSFQWRWLEGDKLKVKEIENLDIVCELMLNFLNVDKRIKTVAFAQGGDFIGGSSNKMLGQLKRKAMNTFFIDTENPVDFIGEINEDVNTYASNGNKGELYYTVPNIMITQMQTQKTENGMTVTYKQDGTYIKSFYTVLLCPSFVKIKLMGDKEKRLHHKIQDRYAYPKLLRE